MELRGRTALLTGAAGGLGGHIARGLASEGVSIALSDLPGDELDARTREVSESGAKAVAVPADLLDPEQRGALVGKAEEALGPIDILVNNAGIEMTAPVIDYGPNELERILEINLIAPVALIRDVVPGMLERGRGHVVSIASLAAKTSPAYLGPYGATKAGLVALTQSLRAEHAGDPVGFSAICPGFVSGEGMIEPVHAAGTDIPTALGTSPPELVSRAVIRSIRKDLPEVVIAHRRPIRALLALYALAPRFVERLLHRSGASYAFEDTARLRGRLPAEAPRGRLLGRKKPTR